MLEFAIKETKTCESYHFELSQINGSLEIDWRPMIIQILGDQQSKVPTPMIAQKFHDTLVEMIVSVAQRARLRRVLLSGGCFMNKYLLDHAVRRLRQAGFVPYWHHQIPTNDGGIAVGQIWAAAKAARK